MSRINSNVPALRAIHQLERNQGDLSIRLERLSTGLRINRGRDDPAGLIASERLRLGIRATDQAIDNSVRAANVISTTEGALNEVNSLLLDLQSLVVEAANKGALTPDEIQANQLQIDSILASIDRIANTTEFGGKKLLDGTEAYTLSALPTGALANAAVFAAFLPAGTTRTVNVKVIQSAQTAVLSFVGSNTAGASMTSATTIELRGPKGTETVSFGSGSTFAEIRTAINNLTVVTGVSAVVSSPGVGGIASALILNSTSFGSDAVVSVSPISGSFVNNGNANTVFTDKGRDVGVLINGQAAQAQGLRADVRSGQLDVRLHLVEEFATTLSSANFTITGGGTHFQLTPEVVTNGQVYLGLESVRTTKLGNAVTGRLFDLRTGGARSLATEQFLPAQQIISEAIDQVSSYRGRLGNIQKNTIDTNINSQGIALENLTASESVIRDADMAEELSSLTRAQILVQSTQSTLQIANSVPNLVLSLLQ